MAETVRHALGSSSADDPHDEGPSGPVSRSRAPATSDGGDMMPTTTAMAAMLGRVARRGSPRARDAPLAQLVRAADF